MRLWWSGKRYRDLTLEEQRRYQALCRLLDANRLHFLLFTHRLIPTYRHWTESGEPFAIVSAEKSAEFEPTPLSGFARSREAEQRRRKAYWLNCERAGELRTRLKDYGYGYLPAWGVWTPAEGEHLSEFSAFVPGLSREQAVRLGRRFDQDSVIWGVGEHYWRIDLITGTEHWPLSVEPRLRRLRLPTELESEVKPTGDGDRWRFLIRKDLPLTIESCLRTSMVVRELAGRRRDYPSVPWRLLRRGQWFFFWRAGCGWITTWQQPYGFSVHSGAAGPDLSCGRNMFMRHLDAYIPLWPTAETAAEIARLRAAAT